MKQADTVIIGSLSLQNWYQCLHYNDVKFNDYDENNGDKLIEL